MSPTLPPHNTSALSNGSTTYFFLRPHHQPNNTYYSDEEEQETGFSEIETVALACFLTLLPLIFGLISYFGLRHCWLRCQRTVEPRERGKPLDKETSERSRSSHALLNDQVSQMKSSESEFSVVPAEERDEHGTSKLAANGSVITMTMKNNHLIVETEERMDEAGEERAGDTAAPLEEVTVTRDGENTALVHVASPKQEPLQNGVNTGLSTSDLSSCSEGSATNKGYRYGNQEEYRVDDDEGGSEYVRQEIIGGGAGSLPCPSLDLGPPPPVVVAAVTNTGVVTTLETAHDVMTISTVETAPESGGLENPAFQPTTPAEPPPTAS